METDRWTQNRWGADQLTAPYEEDELFSPGMGRAGLAPKDQPWGDTAPTVTLCSRTALGKENPPAMGVPVGCGAELSPQVTPPGLTPGLYRAAHQGTDVLAAPGGLTSLALPRAAGVRFPPPPLAV